MSNKIRLGRRGSYAESSLLKAGRLGVRVAYRRQRHAVIIFLWMDNISAEGDGAESSLRSDGEESMPRPDFDAGFSQSEAG